MTENKPSQEEWKELYTDAVRFKELACWRWMEDSQVFGVENPETGEIGYCCVMGILGEVLGLAVYLGDEGLAFFEGMQSGKISPEDDDIHAIQKCLSVTFDNRDMLHRQDLGVIKTLGLKFRGKQEWPLFRSHLPGFVPWFLSGAEARFLTLALRRVMDVAERLKDNPGLLDAPEEGRFLVTYREADKGEPLWREGWRKPEPYEERRPAVPVDEVRLARVRPGLEKVQDSWEVDFFYAPFVVNEGERPFFPYIALYAIHDAYYVLNFCVALHDEFEKNFQENFFELLDRVKVLPKAIMVKKDAAYDFFKPLATALGFSLKRVKRLESVQDARDSLLSNMAG